MDDQIEKLAKRLRYEVTDQAKGVGRYVWADRQPKVDAEVVGYLVNHWRTAGTALEQMVETARGAEAELAATRAALADAEAQLARVAAGPPIEVVEVVPDPTDARPDHPVHPEHPRGRG
jgi:hypothetical protein